MTPAAAFWDRIAPRYAKSKIRDMPSYEHTLTRTAHWLPRDGTVLEVGCGTGTTALKLAPFAGHIHATDVAPGMIAIAKGKLGTVRNVTFGVAGTDTLTDDTFDAVMAFNLLHLVPDLPHQINMLRDRLRPGGTLITKTPCMGDAAWIFRPMVKAMQMVGKAPFVNFFTVAELEATIRHAGFEITERGTFPQKPPSRFIVARKR